MNIHNEIRKEVIDFLTNNISEVEYFHNGIPKITDLDNELPLISVFINNAQADQNVIGYQEWEADLNIVTYAPFFQGEEFLDEISEKIYNAILPHQFNNISVKYVQGYDYEFDDQSSAWVSSLISYRINYKFEQINNFKG